MIKYFNCVCPRGGGEGGGGAVFIFSRGHYHCYEHAVPCRCIVVSIMCHVMTSLRTLYAIGMDAVCHVETLLWTCRAMLSHCYEHSVSFRRDRYLRRKLQGNTQQSTYLPRACFISRQRGCFMSPLCPHLLVDLCPHLRLQNDKLNPLTAGAAYLRVFIRNSSLGGLRPSTLPLGPGGSPQY